jgi:hypothetical protein
MVGMTGWMRADPGIAFASAAASAKAHRSVFFLAHPESSSRRAAL